mgnify:CR=1 FL=1|tara:strand:- start:2486 stop:2683 length:198 start_codon:yes stop_codon:yes gene_type:complete
MDDKFKEYILRIIYDPVTGEIKHLSEYDENSLGYTLEIEGILFNISDEMGEYLNQHTDGDTLGLS